MTTIEQLEAVLRAIPDYYILTKDLAERARLNTVTTGHALAEARRRGFISSREGLTRGYFTHPIQNKGRRFLEWLDAGRVEGLLP